MDYDIQTENSRKACIDDQILSNIESLNKYFINNNLTSECCYTNLSNKVIDYVNSNISKLFQDINNQISHYKNLNLDMGDINLSMFVKDDEKNSKIKNFLQVAIDELADAVQNANFNKIMSDKNIGNPKRKFSLKLYNFHLPKCTYNENIKIKSPPIVLLLDHTISVIWMMFLKKKKKRKAVLPIHCIWAAYFLRYFNEYGVGKKYSCITFCLKKILEELQRLDGTDTDQNKRIDEFSKKFITPKSNQLKCINRNSIIHEKLLHLQKYNKLDLIGRYTLQTLLISLSKEPVDNINNLSVEEKSKIESILNSPDETKSETPGNNGDNNKQLQKSVNNKVNDFFDKLLKSFVLLKDMNKNLTERNGNIKTDRKSSATNMDVIQDNMRKFLKLNPTDILLNLQNNINSMESDNNLRMKIKTNQYFSPIRL